ncbi:MAG: hypothetical protein JXQ72_01350 [Anaerolineae bacterium]|nr:hypothetical protein [Anaerolineae bacterium]
MQSSNAGLRPTAVWPARESLSQAISGLWYWGALALVLLVSAIPRAWNLGGTDLWTDEVLTAQRVTAPLPEALDSILSVGNQAPLYYLAMRVLPHDSALWLRLPAALLGVASVALMVHAVGWLYNAPHLGLQIGALLAVHPMHVILSRTARYYTPLLVLTLIASICFILILRQKAGPRVWAVFLVSSLLAYITHYSTLVLPVVQGMVLVLSWPRTRPIFRRWIITQAIAGLPYALWMVAALRHISPDQLDYPYQSPVPSLVQDAPLTMLNMLVGYDGGVHVNWLLLAGLMVIAGGMAAGTYALGRAWRSQPERLYWILLALVPVVALFVMATFMHVQYRDRYLFVSVPAALMLLLWTRPGQRWVFGTAFLLSAYLTLIMFISGTYARTNWTGAGEYLDGHVQLGDMVIFERDLTYDAFRMHFDGNPAILDNRYIIYNTPDTLPYERNLGRIWAVYRIRHEDFHRPGWDTADTPFRPGLSPMADWLAARQDRVIGQKTFAGITIYVIRGVE